MVEQVNNIDRDIVEAIAETYSHGERAYETDEEDVSEPRIKVNEAIQLLRNSKRMAMI